jgi:4-hydroxybenzoate polyprenyltransferase
LWSVISYRPALTILVGHRKEMMMATLLWILAVVLVVAGIFAIIRKQLLWGVVLIVLGLLVGPGGVSLFNWA